MSAIILDTETHDLHGYPIEIAHMKYDFENGTPKAYVKEIYDEYFSLPEGCKISWGAMATHHILESDLEHKPLCFGFELPADTQYIIAHNVNYDIEAIKKCGVDTSNIKQICTLALARYTWKSEPTHVLSALVYMLMNGSSKARDIIRGAHNAKEDIKMTASVLNQIVAINSIKTVKDLYQLSEVARTPTEMTFGKHKGAPLRKLPADYVQWLLKQDNTDPYLRKALERL